MQKILMLGTSLGSVEIVETAREMGCYTIVTDNLDPELSHAKKWQMNTG